MKEIQIDGRILQYEVFTDNWERGITVFYEGKESYQERKYFFFGKKITKIRPKEIFRIHKDAKNPNILKEWWLKAIRVKLDILKRQEEIDKGELI
jgi:hypothetical protein